MFSFAVTAGDIENQKHVIASMEKRILDMANEKTDYECVIRDLTADKESTSSLQSQLEDTVARQNEIIKENASTLSQKSRELASLRNECDAIKAVNVKLLDSIKAERSKSILPSSTTEGLDAADSTSSVVSAATTSSKKKKSKATAMSTKATSAGTGTVDSNTDAMVTLRRELETLRMQRDVDVKALTDQIELMRESCDGQTGGDVPSVIDLRQQVRLAGGGGACVYANMCIYL